MSAAALPLPLGSGVAPAVPGSPAPETPLPPLREEIELIPGPTLSGGAPSWTLSDPARNRFFRIGWTEFEILCRWRLGRPQEIVRRVNAETALTISPEDVEAFLTFLDRAELLRRSGPADTGKLAARRVAGRRGPLNWLLHHYLFMRIPLLRPEPMLRALLPALSFLYGWTFLAVTLAAGVTGLVLVMRQWDGFVSALPWFFSLEGAALAGLALFCSKALHELGHGLTAVRHGCRVPTMGIAFLVLAPVLYTDTSAAWTLRERRRRLAIGAAGVAFELALAAYALLLWTVLPDGALRSAVYVWATTTWLLTLVINISPFMRFDGYYLLCDLVEIPNLQERAFALTRYLIRRLLFAFDEEPPEYWPPRTRVFLVAYAIGTWTYRFVLFLGIALLVYHMFFKALGLVLFAVEIWYFIMRPVVLELGEWARRLTREKPTRRGLFTCAVLAALGISLFLPWPTSLHLPAVLAARERTQLYLPAAARVQAVHVRVGEDVAAGQPVVSFESPDLAFRLAQAGRNAASLAAQLQAAEPGAGDPARAAVLVQRLAAARAEIAALRQETERLVIRAPFAGTVMELAEPLSIGEWLKAGEAVAYLVDAATVKVDAYVEEAHLSRIVPGAEGSFVPADLALERMPIRVAAIDEMATRNLPDRELASPHGGAIAARQDENRQIIPEIPVYRVEIATLSEPRETHPVIGTAIVAGKPVRPWRLVANLVLRVLYREGTFD
ncbi:HlyD family efflux transporter periplasmic adaptor subunit [Bosea sp. (in: a-proteobacteria)]|uniref:HlyD family efflux transporter periplasmic adaptor subunit n=1 Tax=Bosea sp. (in: a-proteobacteria) TaxID=1871050 RepID=UPI0026191896|nr:HlyD family efflux transporter periplasmic adaptor subunit [Bosea sp. (in: a-proteobacteria)]MCO5090812.1 efflux RND transporter periplasmic adaptor subunit [Bosea sp. (in: a-proteobacteria)]